jgi:ATP-binding cassette, subfamily B, bacterial
LKKTAQNGYIKLPLQVRLILLAVREKTEGNGMKRLVTDFRNAMGAFQKTFFMAGMALVIATLFQLAFPWVLRIAIDSLSEGSATRSSLIILALSLPLVAACEALFTYLRGRWSAKASEGAVCDLRNRLFQHLMRLPMSVQGDIQAGDFIQRATSDIQTLGRFLSAQVTEIARTLCLLVGVSALMLYMQPGLALTALALVPPIFLFSLLFFGKIHHRFERFDEAEASLSTIIQEYLTGIRVVKAFAREDFEDTRFEKANNDMVREDIRLSNLHAVFWPSSDILCMLQAVVVLYFGGMRTLSGDMTLGTFVAFNTYVMFLIWPVRQVGRLLGETGRASVSLQRINDILNMPAEVPESGCENANRPLKGGIYFKKVSFGYEDTPVLKNITFRVKPGKTVAILGATGSGKSTLMKLLLRFHDNYSGDIYIDGRDIRDIPKEELRSQIGLVMQEAFLFSRTIYDNIGFGMDMPSRKDIKQAAVTAAVDKFVSEFPRRYRTIVGERGVTLSGGQKQRIALARVLVKRPSILILDDTTSALDTETESAIWGKLRKSLSGCTAFIITHRLSTAVAANKILVLEDGKIVQHGSHSDLINKPGLYRRLHEYHNARMSAFKEETQHGKQKTGKRKRRKSY